MGTNLQRKPLHLHVCFDSLNVDKGNFLAAYFTVRARALMAFVVAIMGMALNMATGGVLDMRRYRRSIKAKYGWLLIATLFTAMWIWNILLQIDYASRLVTLDWNSRGFHTGAGSFVFFRIVYEMIGVYSYWLLGTYDSSVDTLALTTGILRGCESLGSTFSYYVGSRQSASLLVNLIVAAAVFWASIPSTTWQPGSYPMNRPRALRLGTATLRKLPFVSRKRLRARHV